MGTTIRVIVEKLLGCVNQMIRLTAGEPVEVINLQKKKLELMIEELRLIIKRMEHYKIEMDEEII